MELTIPLLEYCDRYTDCVLCQYVDQFGSWVSLTKAGICTIKSKGRFVSKGWPLLFFRVLEERDAEVHAMLNGQALPAVMPPKPDG